VEVRWQTAEDGMFGEDNTPLTNAPEILELNLADTHRKTLLFPLFRYGASSSRTIIGLVMAFTSNH
jgi:hypothetical protein